MYHVLGYATLVSAVLGGCVVAYLSFTVGRAPKLRAPKMVSAPLSLGSGSDYVGVV